MDIQSSTENSEKSCINQTSQEMGDSVKPSFPCHICGHFLQSKSGRTNYQNKCKKKGPEIKENLAVEEDTPIVLPSNDQKCDVINFPVEITDKPPPRPPDPELTLQLFKWGGKTATEITKLIDTAYEHIVYWRRYLFLVPSGNAGKKYVNETTKLINSFIDASAMKDLSLKAIIIMPALLL